MGGRDRNVLAYHQPHPECPSDPDRCRRGLDFGLCRLRPGGSAGYVPLVAELPSEGVARAATSSVPSGMVEVNGEEVPVTKTGFGEVQDLPEPQVGVLLVVSKITADAASAGGRPVDDLLIVGEAVRDEAGKILGVTGFGRLETTDALQLAIARLDKLITLDVVNLVSNGDGQAALPIIEAATLVTEVARKS